MEYLVSFEAMAKIKSKYKRVLLKLSGEILQNEDKTMSIDPGIVAGIARRLATIAEMDCQVALVIGGGNIFRGASGEARGISRVSGDHMGMLATIINALAIQNACEKEGLGVRVQTAIEMNKIAEPFILKRAIHHLEKGRIVIFAGGTGNPFFSTDTAAALRASEIGADILLKATKVDGVFSSDPMKDPSAKKYSRITYRQALTRSLKIMDASAFSLCMENKIPIIVFNFFKTGSIEGAVRGEKTGTLVTA